MNSKTESDTKTSNMMDSQETLQTEENVTENVTPEVNETENQTIEVPQTQEEVVARVKELAEADARDSGTDQDIECHAGGSQPSLQGV